MTIGVIPDNRQMGIFLDIADERHRQDKRFGERLDQDLTVWLTVMGEEFGEVCRAVLEMRVAAARSDHYDQGVWLSGAREELVQVAAVAVAAIEYIDRQRGIG